MATYKLTSSLTNGIQFEDRFVGIPGEAELTDEEVEIARKVADVYAIGGKISSNAIPKLSNEYIVNKHNEKIVGDDVKEQAPTDLDK